MSFNFSSAFGLIEGDLINYRLNKTDLIIKILDKKLDKRLKLFFAMGDEIEVYYWEKFQLLNKI